MLLERLKSETRAAHGAVESVLCLPGNLEAYRGQLESMLGFVEPWETAVRGTADGTLMEGRERAGRLRTDLAALGRNELEIEALPRCMALPPLAGREEVLGSCYVMEGSTLGGQMIARYLEQTLGLSGGAGYSYHRGAGTDTRARWEQFRQGLAERAEGLDMDRIVAAARATFEALGAWCVRQEAPAP